jgi:hypothetical protein
MGTWQLGPLPVWTWVLIVLGIYVLAHSTVDAEWVVVGLGRGFAAVGAGVVHVLTRLRTG